MCKCQYKKCRFSINIVGKPTFLLVFYILNTTVYFSYKVYTKRKVFLQMKNDTCREKYG